MTLTDRNLMKRKGKRKERDKERKERTMRRLRRVMQRKLFSLLCVYSYINLIP